MFDAFLGVLLAGVVVVVVFGGAAWLVAKIRYWLNDGGER